ncbi:Sir2 histone deacetylase Hst2 [Puccinia graminis f. sp. tritici]|uniref:Sir2 histone deacetylase Hst2 n=1 Tax=Puccinia graminis f. sp. tritici TaxID=56615 RepID=A0A5B0QS82_PUCGR|nr:Sir2 histone deacetylase Hst2 [Puccinia graminis f. sp. tritici]
MRFKRQDPKIRRRVFDGLDGRRLANLDDVATLIKSGRVENIIIMAGAGISTSAGIPDFRSPETGIYANLEKYNLPYPEAIFDIDYFKKNPAPFYTLAKELNPKNYRPTKTHQFFKLLETKKKLKKCFTQNIDTLERLAGLSDHLIVEAHGSFATNRCIECRAEMSDDQFMHQLDQISSPDPLVVKCPEKRCLGKPTALVKPDIVFFGEQLPKKFFGSLTDFQEADLLIVLGTSLQVQPFASLISTVPINCPRLLINLEKVGDIGHRGGGADQGGFDFEGIQRGGKEFIRDVLVLGTTDDGVEELCDLLGWKDQLLDLYDPSRKIQTHGKSLSSTNQKDEPEIEADGGKDQMEGEVLDPEDIKGQAHRDTRSPVLDATSSSSSQANPTSPERRGSQKLPAKLPTQVDTAQPQANPQENQKPEDHVDQLAATVTHLSLSENL